MTLTPGTRLGGYVAEERLGESGSDERWAGSEPGVDRPVLLTITPLPADPAEREATRERLRRRAGLEHPALLPVYGAGEEGDLAWLASRAPAGRRLPEAGGLAPDRAARASEDLRSALAALAGAGLAPARVAPDDIEIEGDRAYLVPGDQDGAGDASSAQADLDRITHGLARSPRGRHRAMAIGAVAALLVCGAVVLSVLLSRDGSDDPTASSAPVAEVAAKIALGSEPRGVALAGGDVWVGSPVGVLRIDPSTNRVVGAPVPVPRGSEVFNVRSGEGVVWAQVGRPDPDAPASLWRIDAATGRVTGRIPVGMGTFDFRQRGDDLWVIRIRPSGADLARFDVRSLRSNRVPLPLSGQPTGLSITAEDVWVSEIDGHTLRVPIDPGTTPVRFRMGGPNFGAAVDESGLWVPDLPGRTVTAYDAASGRPLGDAAVVPYQPFAVRVTAQAVWAATVDAGLFEFEGPVELARIDPSSRRAVGTPVRLGTGFRGIEADEESVWVPTAADRTLWRLTPADFPVGPAGSDGPSSSTSTRPLVAGPLGVGPRTSTDFRVPFGIDPGDDGWVALAETPEGADLVRFDEPDRVISLNAVDRLFRVNGRLAPLRTASQLLERLRADPRLRTSPLPSLRLETGTAQGLRVEVRDIAPQQFCPGTPCVQLFPIEDGSFYLVREPGNVDDVYALDTSGRALVLSVTVPASSDRLAAASAIDDLGFELSEGREPTTSAPATP